MADEEMTPQAGQETAAKMDAAPSVSPGDDAATQKEPETWTIMVYLAGDNNLTDECVYALTEMKKFVGDGRIRIFAQFDPKDDYLPTQRYEITSDGTPGQLVSNQTDWVYKGAFQHESAKAKLKGAAIEEAKRAAHAAGAAAARRIAGGTVELPGDDQDSNGDNETDTGSPFALYSFMSYCVETRPADHYMVVLAGHGSGTSRDYLLKDDSPAGYLTINELKRAFQDIQTDLGADRKIDILGMDTCLMSMAEVCYELREQVKVLVGCESYSPASGWPYQQILDRLKELTLNQTETPVEESFGAAIVDEYVDFYSDYWLGGLSVDQAALDLSKAVDLKTLVDNLADALQSALVQEEDEIGAALGEAAIAEADRDAERKRRSVFKNALILAHWEAQSYNGEEFVDLFDFCQCLRDRSADATVNGCCKAVMDFISGTFVLKSCYSGPVYQYSYGVSIYFPWARVAPSYMNLDFATDGAGVNWAEFLRTYVTMTRREPRKIKGRPELSRLNREVEVPRLRQTQGKGPDNPIHSMRNPPIVPLPLGPSSSAPPANECTGRESKS
ncbi:MAG: hypothetical protein QOD00_1490 [Blastocatellia bacterium]|jgi:hypothetical protein|nr:hypothetical protein [Blastocatellia bacterium]